MDTFFHLTGSANGWVGATSSIRGWLITMCLISGRPDPDNKRASRFTDAPLSQAIKGLVPVRETMSLSRCKTIGCGRVPAVFWGFE